MNSTDSFSLKEMLDNNPDLQQLIDTRSNYSSLINAQSEMLSFLAQVVDPQSLGQKKEEFKRLMANCKMAAEKMDIDIKIDIAR